MRTNRTFGQRAATLRTGTADGKLDGTTVFDDTAIDGLTGAAGNHWCFATRGGRVQDRTTERNQGSAVNEIQSCFL